MDKVISLFASNDDIDVAHSFMLNTIIPWLEAQGVDIYADSFKYSGATILSCLQGLLHD